MYLRSSSFKNKQEAGIQRAANSLRKSLTGQKGIVEVGFDLTVSDTDIYVFVNRKSAKVPKIWGRHNIIRYDLNQAKTDCDKIIQRFKDEKIAIDTDEVEYFAHLIATGKSICEKLLVK